jgi:hypothetical protein
MDIRSPGDAGGDSRLDHTDMRSPRLSFELSDNSGGTAQGAQNGTLEFRHGDARR